jgi:prevent-host-death family protein
MSVTISFEELQQQLSDLLSRAARGDEEYIIERDGEEYVVILSARQWRSQPGVVAAHQPASGLDQRNGLAAVSRRVDHLGPEYRLAAEKQARTEELLARDGQLTPAERSELDDLVREADEILLRRARALDQTG